MLDAKLMRFAAAMSSAALTQGILVFLGYWGGAKLDVAFHTKPAFTILLIVAAIALGIYYFIVIFNKTKPS